MKLMPLSQRPGILNFSMTKICIVLDTNVLLSGTAYPGFNTGQNRFRLAKRKLGSYSFPIYPG
jgi:hypothetical protein